MDWIRIDPRSVAHETIEGEVIMIHLQQGNYYSLGGPGADIWQWLVEGHSRQETLALIAERYEASDEEIARTLDGLLEQLAAEGLVVPVAASPNGNANSAIASAGGERAPLTKPELQKYTDMQDFLLVDPIHETGDSGWPSTKPAA